MNLGVEAWLGLAVWTAMPIALLVVAFRDRGKPSRPESPLMKIFGAAGLVSMLLVPVGVLTGINALFIAGLIGTALVGLGFFFTKTP